MTFEYLCPKCDRTCSDDPETYPGEFCDCDTNPSPVLVDWRERALSAEKEASRFQDAIIRLQSAKDAERTDVYEMDGTDGAHPAWWRGCDYGASRMVEELAKARAERDKYRDEVKKLRAARRKLYTFDEPVESCNELQDWWRKAYRKLLSKRNPKEGGE